MKIKGVIFDFNGTLFWDTELHYQAWDIFLDKYGLNINEAEKDDIIHGRNNEYILDRIYPEKLSPDEIKRLSIEKEDMYQELCLEQKLQLASGSVDLFKFLKENNIPFTIATGSDFHNVDFYFRYLGLEDYFDISKVIYSNGSIKSKPDPQIFQEALKVLGLKNDEVLIFEDSEPGIKAAENVKAGEIIIVRSDDRDYSKWNHKIIKDFAEVDRSVFDIR
ncbi:MAG: HAD family phosphatase [Bacteroidales bacterium]|nr:HAD family phosphatase [Bacteroidales bacterium]